MSNLQDEKGVLLDCFIEVTNSNNMILDDLNQNETEHHMNLILRIENAYKAVRKATLVALSANDLDTFHMVNDYALQEALDELTFVYTQGKEELDSKEKREHDEQMKRMDKEKTEDNIFLKTSGNADKISLEDFYKELFTNNLNEQKKEKSSHDAVEEAARIIMENQYPWGFYKHDDTDDDDDSGYIFL